METIKEQTLPKALERIFSHASDGMVKDDAAPFDQMVSAVKATKK